MPQDYRTSDTANDAYFSTHPEHKIDKRHFYYRVKIEGKCVRYLSSYFRDVANFIGDVYTSSQGSSSISISGYSTEPDIGWLQHVIETEFPALEVYIEENGKELFTQ